MTKEYFPKPINSTDEFFKKLELKRKVKNLNSLEFFERQKRLDEGIEETKRDYIRMNAGSIISARECYIL